MGDRSPEIKPEEQYPLLKVDGGGDSSLTQTMLTPGWGVQVPRKNCWCSRWPEVMSACWMTMILFGISFLVFYALGMGTYRRQQFVFVKCNSSRPASNVFYHHIIQRGDQVPFLRHSEYLSNVAAQYPYLHFNVIYLVDDSYTARGPRQNRFINKLIPYYPYGTYSYKMDENYQQALVEFQRRFRNVNVTVMALSKYMSQTSLRYKWRTIPTTYLPFYARVFSVWENGGIGIDLALQSVYDDSLASKRKAAILKQHNDGINPEAYANALEKIDKEMESPRLESGIAVLLGFVNDIFNETRSFINRTLTFAPTTEESIPDIQSRAHRAKRDVSNNSIETTYQPNVLNSSVDDVVQVNDTGLLVPPVLELMNDISLNTNHSKPNATSESQVVLFYDFQIFSDNMIPSYVPLVASEFGPTATGVVRSRGGRDVKRSSTPVPHLLSIDPEGTFVAASSKLHPFLGHLISSGCQRMAPKFAIQDGFLTQCSGFLREDVYCNNIYTL